MLIPFLDLTAPYTESTLLCYLSTGRPFVMDPELDLERLLSSYLCKSTCSITTKKLEWKCLAMSTVSELHNGYMTFNSGLDFVISHTRNVMFGKFLFFKLLCFVLSNFI